MLVCEGDQSKRGAGLPRVWLHFRESWSGYCRYQFTVENRNGPVLDDFKVSNKANTQRCMLLISFLKEVSITVKRRLTDSVISSSRNTAVHIYFNLKYVVSC